MNLSFKNGKLLIDLEWFEQLWAFTFTNRFEIPLSHIDRATTEEPRSSWAEIRAPGTYLPGVIKAGTYYTKRGKEFWYVTADHNYLILELSHEPYRRFVLTLAQNDSWSEQINRNRTAAEN